MSHLGYKRGPCKRSEGNPDVLRGTHGDASVKYTNFMVGELDSTYTKLGRGYLPENEKQRKWPPPGAALQPSGSSGQVPGERAGLQPVHPSSRRLDLRRRFEGFEGFEG